MPEHTMNAQPVIRKQRGPSMIWLIPLVTLIAGGLLVSKYLAERGPEITITFKTADGIEKKTPIKYKDVQIGTVKKIRFSEDFNHVVLTARMAASAEPFLREGTRFWVVRPHLSLHGASGLNTLLSGTYIEVDPGEGGEQYEFTGLEEAPSLTSDANGLRITLQADKLGSLDIGAPVYYKGMPVGKILDYELDAELNSVLIHAFIRKPYDELVHAGSHFWNISGIDASVDGSGFRLHSPSLLTMIFGGIAFDSPPRDKAEALPQQPTFRLYARYDDILRDAYRQKLHFVTFFEGSIHGLDVGAPVEFQGLRIGQVTGIRLEFDHQQHSYRIPVMLEIEPERMPGPQPRNPQQIRRTLLAMIAQGLRAQLQTSSLLTGKLYVGLTMHPDDKSPRLLAGADNTLPEIPSVPGGLDQMQASLQNILGKLEKLDARKMGDDLKTSLHAFRRVAEKLDMGKPDEVLLQARQTLKSLERVLDPASPTQYRIDQMSRDLSEMARAIRAFVDMLERHPNALIFGNSQAGE